MAETPLMLPLSGIRVIWCDGASAVEIQGDMSDVTVEPTVHTYPVESGESVDNFPIGVGYIVTCQTGYTSDLLIALSGSSEAATLVVLDLASGANWVIPAHLANAITAGAPATVNPGELITSELILRQRRGQRAHIGRQASAISNPADSGVVPAGSRVYAAVTAAGTIDGVQRAAGFHDLGAARVQGASTAAGYLVVASPAEIED